MHPLREGGSLPALIEVDGGDLFVAKWRGAGQGATALVAEVIVGVLALTITTSLLADRRDDARAVG